MEDKFTKISLLCEQINWSSFELSVLHAYRQAHRLNTPSAFSSSFNQRILSRPGIGWSSPTMAVHKDRRRVSKDNLALAVRKDFKDAMVHESEAITSFLYSVHNQGQSVFDPNVLLHSSFRGKTKTSACGLLPLGRNKMLAVICWRSGSRINKRTATLLGTWRNIWVDLRAFVCLLELVKSGLKVFGFLHLEYRVVIHCNRCFFFNLYQ